MNAPTDVGLPAPTPRASVTSPPEPLSAPQNQASHYAGFASRSIAFVFDCVISIGAFELVIAAASFAASVLTGT